jgi:hypothetical protein
MTILGFKIDFSGMSAGEFIEEYSYYSVDINEDDSGFWDYYEKMRGESLGFVEDYRRSNQHYPKLRNLTRTNSALYDSLPEDRQLVASWVWLDCPEAH